MHLISFRFLSLDFSHNFTILVFKISGSKKCKKTPSASDRSSGAAAIQKELALVARRTSNGAVPTSDNNILQLISIPISKSLI